MPIYTCIDVHTCEEVEVHRPMASSPRIGQEFAHEGRTVRRVASCFVHEGVASVVHGYPYTSNSLPRNLAGCSTDPTGRPIVRSRRHERELMTRHGLERD